MVCLLAFLYIIFLRQATYASLYPIVFFVWFLFLFSALSLTPPQRPLFDDWTSGEAAAGGDYDKVPVGNHKKSTKVYMSMRMFDRLFVCLFIFFLLLLLLFVVSAYIFASSLLSRHTY